MTYIYFTTQNIIENEDYICMYMYMYKRLCEYTPEIIIYISTIPHDLFVNVYISTIYLV